MIISVVLDASALMTIASPSDVRGVHAGELIDMIAQDNEAQVGIPAACLITAWEHLDTRGRAALADFVVHQSVVTVLGLDPDDALRVADLNLDVGSLVGGHAVVEALRFNARLVTTEFQRARQALGAEVIIDLSDDGTGAVDLKPEPESDDE